MRTVLTIAGSDPSGGAGIQADLKTLAAFGVYGVSAITAVTVQSTKGVEDTASLSSDLVTAQIEAIAGDVAIHATKVGMLGTAAIVEAVAAAIVELELPLVVVDPVLVSSNGAFLLDDEGLRMLRVELLPRLRVVTPNIPEAEALSGRRIESLEDARDAARLIHKMGAAAVIITGGHGRFGGQGSEVGGQGSGVGGQRLEVRGQGSAVGGRRSGGEGQGSELGGQGLEVVDLLFDGRAFHELRVARIDGRATHGTGCTYASAVAAGLALGLELPAAAARAQQYVAGAIAHALAIGQGRAVLDHFWERRR
jgi:hydroxymethylpyrimidine/phosphomethylpyrimidine kinase